MSNTTRAWSSQQTAIFNFFAKGKGNLVVRARAGTGKTTTIIEALSHATHEDRILLAAFNKRIAVELTSRISAENAEAKTLHALGFGFIRAKWRNITVDADVDYDRARDACGNNAPDDVVVAVQKLASLLKSCAPLTSDLETVKDLGEEFDLLVEDEEEGWDETMVCERAMLARDMAKVQDAKGRISFDDMVYIPVACDMVRRTYSMVVVDEAQDMNASQLLLAQGACKKSGRVVVVGDDCQAIYGFRGADADGIDRLKVELQAKELGLTVTYRCAQRVVEVARILVPDFSAADTNPLGTVDSIGMDKIFDQAQPGDFVLSRKNAPLMGLCLGFLKRGIAARIEGRDVAAGLRAIVNSFRAKSVPAFIERVEGWHKKQAARAQKISRESTRENKLAEVKDKAEMLVALAEGCASVPEILTRVNTLFGDSESGEVEKKFVVCSSVHRAKGLEADRVFVLVHTLSEKGREEKNISYVAYTRAKSHLTMVQK
jgi:superfamily I DNA/RNA helicase